jgi:NTE family protein
VARAFAEVVVDPIRRMAATTIDVGSVLRGVPLPGSVGGRIARSYDKVLFGGRTLQALPGPGEGPRFVINATNLQSGVLWRFSRPYMADYLVGRIDSPKVPLAVAVAASSAFPPFLSPVVLKPDASSYTDESRGWPLHQRPYTTKVHLSDGGVYDNLGLETVKRFKTLLVSDGGGRLSPAPKPPRTWARHGLRVLTVIDNQVRSLRKRDLITAFRRGHRQGTYWGVRTDIGDYGFADALPCPHERTLALADTPTRLGSVRGEVQEQLINWGYAVCDAGLRRWVDPSQPSPDGFPYPGAGVG